MSRGAMTWLSEQGYEQAREELSRLLLAYRSSRHSQPDNEVPGADGQRAWTEQRIRQLQELLLTADVGPPPPDDGIAEPGMVLTVRHTDGATDTFLLATRGSPVDRDMAVCSPQSPLGRALLGAQQGDTRSYPLPDGTTTTVTLLHAEPFR